MCQLSASQIFKKNFAFDLTFHTLESISPNYPKSSKILLLVLPDFDRFSAPQYSPVNIACSHVCQIHQTPPAASVGFKTVYSQAMDALYLLLY